MTCTPRALASRMRATEPLVLTWQMWMGAPMEAAAMLAPRPEVGDRISYYIARGDGKRVPDWKNARPTALYDAEKFPYDADYYARKIDDWRRRFSDLISDEKQAELF